MLREGKAMSEMISLEEARALVLSHVRPLPVETVPVLEAVGRVAATDLGPVDNVEQALNIIFKAH